LTASQGSPYRLVLTRVAIRAIEQRLPESVAAAAIKLINGDLLHDPKRVGKPLRDEADLVGLWSARRGTYRVLYEIDDEACLVRVVRVDHRRDIYRRY
jgi:mRNA interferase RelE/StbE